MLFKLLTAPFNAPLAGITFVLRQVGNMAEREMNNVEHLREELLLLQVRLEDGEISEEEYASLEADVMARLRAVRQRQMGL